MSVHFSAINPFFCILLSAIRYLFCFLIILSRHITKPNLVSDISIDFVWLPVPVVVFPFAWSCDSDETGYFGGINPFLYFLGFFPFVVFIIANAEASGKEKIEKDFTE